MKSVLLLLSLLGLAWGQLQLECNCGLFVTTEIAELEVYRLLPFELFGCDEFSSCSILCLREFDYLFENGGMNYIPPSSTLSVGEQSCANLAAVHGIQNFDPAPVYSYYKVCDSLWLWDGLNSRDTLCCVDGKHC